MKIKKLNMNINIIIVLKNYQKNKNIKEGSKQKILNTVTILVEGHEKPHFYLRNGFSKVSLR